MFCYLCLTKVKRRLLRPFGVCINCQLNVNTAIHLELGWVPNRARAFIVADGGYRFRYIPGEPGRIRRPKWRKLFGSIRRLLGQ